MSSIQPNSTSVFRAPNRDNFDRSDLTRNQKMKSFMGNVLPAAIGRGFEEPKLSKQLLGLSDLKSAAKATDLPGAPAIAGKSSIWGDLLGGIGKLTDIFKGFGKSTSTVAKGAKLPGAAGVAGKASLWGGVLGGISGIADLAMNWGKSTPSKGAASGAAAGAAIGSIIPGVGNILGGAVGAVVGGLLGFVKTGKHKDQKMRDQVRKALVSNGILDSNYTIGLADGSRFDIGIDGGPKKELGGRRPFEVDSSNPLAKYAVSWMNPVIALLSKGNEKIHTDFVGYFANAALSNAKSIDDVKANVNAIIKQFGLDDEAIAKGTKEALAAGLIDEGVAMAWLNGIEERTNPEVQLNLEQGQEESEIREASSVQ